MLCRFCRITGGFSCRLGNNSGSLSCFSALLCSFCGTFGSLRIRFRLCSFIFRGFSGVFGFNSRCLCSHSPLFSQFGLVCCLVGVLCRLSCRGLGLFCYITGVFGLGLCCFSLGFGSLRRGIGINCLIFCVYGIGFGILRVLCRLRGLGFGRFGTLLCRFCCITGGFSCRVGNNSGCLCGFGTLLCGFCSTFGSLRIGFGLCSLIGRGCSGVFRGFRIIFGLLCRGIGINCGIFCRFSILCRLSSCRLGLFCCITGVFSLGLCFNSRCLCSHSPLFSQFGFACCLVGVCGRCGGCIFRSFCIGFGLLRRRVGIDCLIFCVYGIGFCSFG